MKRGGSDPRIEERTITSFFITLVTDNGIIDEPCVPMVDNFADKRQVLSDPLYDGTRPPKSNDGGKEGAIGIPGGGEDRGELETPVDTALNELRKETGFIGTNPKGLFIQPKIVIECKKNGNWEYESNKPFVVGTYPSFHIDKKRRPRRRAIENAVCVFAGDINWEGSTLQKILYQIKNEEGLTPQDIREEGIYVRLNDLNKEEKAALNIKETKEIKMIGLFPLSLILEIFSMLGGKNNLLLPDWVGSFYPAHIIRIAGACRMLGGPWGEKFEEEFFYFKQRGGTFLHTPYYEALGYLSNIVGAKLVA